MIALLSIGAGCAGPPRHEFTWQVMGTYFRVTILGVPRAKALRAAGEAFTAVVHIDSALSIYKPNSEFSRINASAGGDTVSVSASTFALLETSRRMHQLTSGAFDPSVGPLMRLWKLQGEGHVPTEAEIDSTRHLVGFARVMLDSKARKAYVPAGMRLDPGGIGKGYAADYARAVLAREGITRCMVDLGGNLALLGAGPSQQGTWSVGIRNPLDQKTLIGSLEVRDISLATSGQYEQYFIKDGIRYGHILDPRTGRPAKEMLSVTILAVEATSTDALSTGVFVLGPARGMNLVEQLPGVEAIIVLDPGVDGDLTREHVLVSSGLHDRIRWTIP